MTVFRVFSGNMEQFHEVQIDDEGRLVVNKVTWPKAMNYVDLIKFWRKNSALPKQLKINVLKKDSL